MNARIQAQNLSYSIDNTQILRNIALSVMDRKMVGIIGPNGSGKTTLLKHIYRALPVEKNVVFINGKEINEYNYNESAKELTVVKQENPSDFEFTVEGMVVLGRAPYHRSYESFTPRDYEIAHQALKSVGMETYAHRSYNALSGGEKQRVLIARSLAQQADIYVLDEPTNHLDVHYQWSLMELIKTLDATILGVFHEMNLAAHYCDELYVLSNGQIIAYGIPSEIITRQLMAEVFKVNADIVLMPDGHPHILIQGAITAENADSLQ